jgi:hypothetical protein
MTPTHRSGRQGSHHGSHHGSQAIASIGFGGTDAPSTMFSGHEGRPTAEGKRALNQLPQCNRQLHNCPLDVASRDFKFRVVRRRSAQRSGLLNRQPVLAEAVRVACDVRPRNAPQSADAPSQHAAR